MQALTQELYQQLRQDAEVVEADSHGDKVLRLPNGNYIKLFRRKRLISSALIWPYAQRFADNASALHDRNIPTLQVIAVYRVKTLQRDLVHYCPLAGKTLRQIYQAGESTCIDLHRRLGSFVAGLHQQGIYFRSLHLGNIVMTPEGDLGLIDISDLRIMRRPLNKSERLRNFKHMIRYQADHTWLLHKGNDFAIGYLQQSPEPLSTNELAQALSSKNQ